MRRRGSGRALSRLILSIPQSLAPILPITEESIIEIKSLSGFFASLWIRQLFWSKDLNFRVKNDMKQQRYAEDSCYLISIMLWTHNPNSLKVQEWCRRNWNSFHDTDLELSLLQTECTILNFRTMIIHVNNPQILAHHTFKLELSRMLTERYNITEWFKLQKYLRCEQQTDRYTFSAMKDSKTNS